MLQELIMTVLPYVLSFLIGLVLKSPVYQSSKALAKEVTKALEDNKLSKEEIELIYEKAKKLVEAVKK